MNLEDVREINDLFLEFYPYIVNQIMGDYKREEGLVLELGPFSSGISMELANRYPKLGFVIGAPQKFFEYLRDVVELSSLKDRAEVREVNLHYLSFPQGKFDLAIFRGGLFFWERTEEILKEMYRVLKHGGLAIAGGGFGRDAPDDLIERILPRSRDINRRLGKRSSSKADLEELVEKAELGRVASIEDKHGLWIYLRKPIGKDL